jgi:general secretion pathway protein A
MYAHFYQLSESPFNLTPDPKFHYVNESTREALAAVLHGIKSRKGFLTLIGEAGTGKTTLLKRVLDEIEGETQVVFVFNPGVSFDELLQFICMELEVATDGGRRLQLLDKLNAYLLDQLTKGRNVVVMIDEAQTLEDGVLEELRLLSNLETSKEKILQILLCGQPELEEKLRRPHLRQLRQRVAVRATLRPMRPDEIGPYIETRLRSAGAARMDFFTPAALAKVWSASHGIPRIVNVICDNAMMIAFADGKRRITNRVIAEAVREFHGKASGVTYDVLRGWLALPHVRYALGAAVAAALMMALFAPALLERLFAVADSPQAVQAAIPQTSGLPSGEPARPAAAPLPVQASPEAAAVDRAIESSPSSASVATDLPVAAPVRESMEQAATTARETAARLYGVAGDDRVEQKGEAAPAVQAAFDAPPAARNGSSAVGHAESSAVVPSPAADAPGARQAAHVAAPEAVSPAAHGDVDARRSAAQQGKGSAQASQAAALHAAATDDARSQSEALPNMKPVKAGSLPVGPSPSEGPPQVVPDAAPAQATQGAARLDPPASAQTASVARDGDLGAAVLQGTGAQPAPADLGPGPDDVIVGQLVNVLPGDNLWDIAIAYYGTAGPGTLKRLLNVNPGIRDPRRLDVGSRMYLPWQRAEQMVGEASDGTYTVVVAVAPTESRLAPARRWVSTLVPDARLLSAEADLGYQLRVVGVPSRDEALQLAARLLREQGRVKEPSTRPSA